MQLRPTGVPWIVVLLVFGLLPGAGAVRAQEDIDDLAVPPPDDVPCVIDEHLSLWLALESADRMIGRLERERRGLAADLAQMLDSLDLLARAEDPSGVPIEDLTSLVRAKSIGHDAIRDNYNEIQTRLIDVDKTLERRRAQQAMLETRIETLLENPPDDDR